MPISKGSHLLIWDAYDNPLYEGRAIRTGADTSESIWQIKKYIWVLGLDGGQVLEEELWSDGNTLYDNEWDNYVILTYLRAV